MLTRVLTCDSLGSFVQSIRASKVPASEGRGRLSERKPLLGQASRPRHLSEQTLPGGVFVPSWVTERCCRAPESYSGRFLSGKFACWYGKIPFAKKKKKKVFRVLQSQTALLQFFTSVDAVTRFPSPVLLLLCGCPSCGQTFQHFQKSLHLLNSSFFSLFDDVFRLLLSDGHNPKQHYCSLT